MKFDKASTKLEIRKYTIDYKIDRDDAQILALCQILKISNG